MSLPLAGTSGKTKTVDIKGLYEEVVRDYHKEDFFDIMFFGSLNFASQKSTLESKKASLGDSLKKTIGEFALQGSTGKKIFLESKNSGTIDPKIDASIEEDKTNKSGNMDNFVDFKKDALYQLIAYVYDKEIMLKFPVSEWASKMIFISPRQAMRTEGRDSQMETITNLYHILEGSDGEGAVLFDFSWKDTGFQQLNITVKVKIKEDADLTPKQRAYLKDLSDKIEIIPIKMFDENKKYLDIPENKEVFEGEHIIEIVDERSQEAKIRLSKIYAERTGLPKKEILRRMLVANAANAWSVGGDPLGGGTGQEESLIRSDTKLYTKLLMASKDYYEDLSKIKEKKEKYKELAINVMAQIEVCKKSEAGKLPEKLLNAMETIRKPLTFKDDNERKTFILDLLTNPSFKLKKVLVEQIDIEKGRIKPSDKDVEKLAIDMLHRKAKDKVVLVLPDAPPVDFEATEEPASKTPHIQMSDGTGYLVLNAPDLRALKEYMASRIYAKLSKSVEDGNFQVKGDASDAIEKAITEEATRIQKTIEEKMKKRVRNNVKHQMAAALEKAKGRFDYLVLVAVGGGIFKNPAEQIAEGFKDVLVRKGYKNLFKHITFAIYHNGPVISEFRRVFGSEAS